MKPEQTCKPDIKLRCKYIPLTQIVFTLNLYNIMPRLRCNKNLLHPSWNYTLQSTLQWFWIHCFKEPFYFNVRDRVQLVSQKLYSKQTWAYTGTFYPSARTWFHNTVPSKNTILLCPWPQQRISWLCLNYNNKSIKLNERINVPFVKIL